MRNLTSPETKLTAGKLMKRIMPGFRGVFLCQSSAALNIKRYLMINIRVNERSGLYPNLAPVHPGPIGNPKTGLLKRYSFMTTDPETGKTVRKYHNECISKDEGSNRSKVNGLPGL